MSTDYIRLEEKEDRAELAAQFIVRTKVFMLMRWGNQDELTINIGNAGVYHQFSLLRTSHEYFIDAPWTLLGEVRCYDIDNGVMLELARQELVSGISYEFRVIGPDGKAETLEIGEAVLDSILRNHCIHRANTCESSCRCRSYGCTDY